MRTVILEAKIVERRAVRAEPHASCWICRSVWLQLHSLMNSGSRI